MRRKRLTRALAALIFFFPRDRAFFLFFPIGNSRTLFLLVRELLLLLPLLCRERERERYNPPPRSYSRKTREEIKRTNEQTHPCIARLRISPILSSRRRRFPKTPRRPTLSRWWTRRRLTQPSSRRRRCVSVPSLFFYKYSLYIFYARERAFGL